MGSAPRGSRSLGRVRVSPATSRTCSAGWPRRWTRPRCGAWSGSTGTPPGGSSGGSSRPAWTPSAWTTCSSLGWRRCRGVRATPTSRWSRTTRPGSSSGAATARTPRRWTASSTSSDPSAPARSRLSRWASGPPTTSRPGSPGTPPTRSSVTTRSTWSSSPPRRWRRSAARSGRNCACCPTRTWPAGSRAPAGRS